MHLGFIFLVLLGGLKGISRELYESADIDGAGNISQFWHITLPMLSPVLFFSSVVTMISSIQAFGQFNIMTKGGPADSTNVVVYELYREAFVNFQFGTASAMAMILFMAILLLTIIQFALGEKKVFYQ